MVTVELPKFDVNHVEIFITEEISVFVNVILTLNVEQTLSNFGLPILPKRYLSIELPISPIHYTVYDA